MQKINFTNTLKLFHEYSKLRQSAGKETEYLTEIGSRLSQINRFIKKAVRLDSKMEEFPREYFEKYAPNLVPRTVMTKYNREMHELEDITEHFYYSSHRILTLTSLISELKGVHAKGITIVRNQLIEHPEKKSSGVMMISFACGGKFGPVVKGPRCSSQQNTHKDMGLYVNAKELKDNFEKVLKDNINEHNQWF